MTTPSGPSEAAQRGVQCIGLREAWEELRRVREAIEAYFANSDEELRVAATMTAIELAENVLKHSSDAGSGVVSMSQEADAVVISTQNRVASVTQALAVREHIANIERKGAREMYVARMLEVMKESDSPGSGLGLLRIVYEGGFDLSCEVLGDVLHIHARRSHALSS